MKSLAKLRSIALSKVNRLQRCHRHLDELQPAFADWAAGEIYVCRKTGTYRYRFGDRSKSIAAWDPLAREIFQTPEAFAFAAMVFAEPAAPESTPAPLPASTGRVNVLALAAQAA